MTAGPVLAVVEHRMLFYRKTWIGSAFVSFAFPVILLIGMGTGMGAYVNSRDTLGMDFLSFLAPGLLASAVFQLAVTEATFPVLRNLEWNRTYHAALATPVGARDLLVGDLIALVLRALLSAVIFLVVMRLFGVVHSAWALLVLPVSGLLALAVSAPVFAYSIIQLSSNSFLALYRLAVIPVALFSGVFFPAQQLPAPARYPVYLSPLWHAVELCRELNAGPPGVPMLGHVGYLLAWAVPGVILADRAFRRRLVV